MRVSSDVVDDILEKTGGEPCQGKFWQISKNKILTWPALDSITRSLNERKINYYCNPGARIFDIYPLSLGENRKHVFTRVRLLNIFCGKILHSRNLHTYVFANTHNRVIFVTLGKIVRVRIWDIRDAIFCVWRGESKRSQTNSADKY